MYIDKLADIVNEYNSTCIRTINLKPIDVKSSICIDFNMEINDKDSKFEVGNCVRISRYKNIFAKGYALNWSVEVSVIK